MSRIIVTTDSTADIPADIAEKYNIRVAPLHVLYDSEDFADGVDILPEDILNRFEENGQLPSTSAATSPPSPPPWSASSSPSTATPPPSSPRRWEG